MPPMAPAPLSADRLRRSCDPDRFAFQTTADLEELVEFVGQDRATEAIGFGLGIKRDGYNIFLLGLPGTGRHTFARENLRRRAKDKATASDWCYVNNFEDTQHPRALRLPSGTGRKFRSAIESLLKEIQTALPAAFESDDYRTRRQAIEDAFREAQSHVFEGLQEKARGQGITLLQTPTGMAFAPVREGDVITPEQFQKLPEDERKRIEAAIESLGRELQQAMQSMPKRARLARQDIDKLDREIARFVVGSLIDDLLRLYADLPQVSTYLRALLGDVTENAELFMPQAAEAQQGGRGPAEPRPRPGEAPVLRRYGVNLFVENSGIDGAPVVFEDNPTYQNLLGDIQHVAQMGTLVTDFQLLKPGALHRANGGYLVLDTAKVLAHPFAWDGLKRALRARHIRIESLGQSYSLLTTLSLEPDPIPLDVKVVLLCDHLIYYLLQEFDPEIFELFKVTVELDDRIQRTADNDLRIARLIATLARREGLKALSRAAVAAVIDESARMASDAERLSTRIRGLADLVREADYWASSAGRDVIEREDVMHAVTSRIKRSSRIRERVQEEILRNTILIDTAGVRIGQINGLSVLQIGEVTFGRPSRITARLHVGAGRVIDIEREVQLGGPLHSKGVLILSSYLAAHYASNEPLSLSASLVFEQSYGGVDGDSASSAELYALVSALADVPIKQSLAVTGSVNQYGEVQAIGGVNEKIEGFFDICVGRGLTGEQGVIIPSANVKHLMLRADVVDAVAAGRFAVYAVDTIDEGLAILTGEPAGTAQADGTFPAGSVNERARLKLLQYAERRRRYGQAPAEAGPPARPGTGNTGETPS